MNSCYNESGIHRVCFCVVSHEHIPGQCIKTVQDVAIYVIISHDSCDHSDRPQDITSLLHKCISYFNP